MFLKVPVMIHGMKKRTQDEVGALVKARRLQLHMTPRDVVSQSGVDPKTYASFEDGTRWPQERTRLKIEAVLGWQPGSIAEALLGHDPIEVGPDRASGDRLQADVEADRIFAALESLSDSAANLLVRSDQPMQRVLESTQIQQAALQILEQVMHTGATPSAIERGYSLWRRLKMADLVEKNPRVQPLSPPDWYLTKEKAHALEAASESSASSEGNEDEEAGGSLDDPKLGTEGVGLDEISRLIVSSAGDVDKRDDGGKQSG